MRKTLAITPLLLGAALINGSPAWALQYDAKVTPNVIMGNGVGNGSWTVDQSNGIELGLRGKTRWPANGTYNSNGDGTYSFATGAGVGQANPSRPVWNFEWSINSDYLATSAALPLSTYTYVLGMDFDPSQGTSFTSYSLSTPMDNSFGYNTTLQSAGVEDSVPFPNYSNYLTTYNVVQNSWSPHWFGAFDPTVDGTYDFFLAAYDKNSGDQLAKTQIQVIVGKGGAAVPDASSTLGLLTLALASIGALSFRRQA